MKRVLAVPVCVLALLTSAIPPDHATGQTSGDDADAFGALPFFYSAELSADGRHVVAVGPGKGTDTLALVVDLDSGPQRKMTPVARADGQPMSLSSCNWSAPDRVVCYMRGITRFETTLLPVARTIAIDTNGQGNAIVLGQGDSNRQLGVRQFDGYVIDWLDGLGGKVLMTRNNVPDFGTGTRLGRSEDGLSVELVDTHNGKARVVEKARNTVVDYVSDGRGTVRLMTTMEQNERGLLLGQDKHFYRMAGDKGWKALGTTDADGRGMTPLAVDPNINAAYVLQLQAGRQALFRVTLDGTGTTSLVFASPTVDVDDVVRIGRGGRVIGMTWTTDREQTEYFDPAYRDLHATLARALPDLPLIRFVSASADEQSLLVWAGSDVDPGHLYAYDRASQKLSEVFPSRPALNRRKLSPVRAITYPAADGTQIPAYLTLPPGVTEARGLPAIVMPHGGPAARDEWGFDWLAQFFAQRGFVVLQPNFRGSAGFGDQWFVDNGFKSWKLAVGDICDGGRWLVAQGSAEASKLAIFGWSYGGYAALQAHVLAPDLFKAVMAVAPVTDLAMLKIQAQSFTSSDLVEQFVGNGPHVTEGSPLRNVGVFKAPVLMFHGDQDINVDIEQSNRMNEALHQAGKTSELVVYPQLEHSLLDGAARADMLRRSDAFLRRNLGL